MTVRAILRDGREVELSSRYGQTVDEAVTALSGDSLTGSAMPLADALVEAADGTDVPYADINTLVDDGSLF